MSILKGQKIPAPSPMSGPPDASSPGVQAAGALARNGGQAMGRYQTILTSGLGVQTPATVAKKTLLGGAA